jgi:hypothetical protein
MAVKCGKCGREYDATLFQFERTVRCQCGAEVSLERGHRETVGIDWQRFEREIFDSAQEAWEDRQRADHYRRCADRIAALILYSDMPRVDIEIEIEGFRTAVLESFPDKEELFDALYMSRFRRLWNQFRATEEPLFHDEY